MCDIASVIIAPEGAGVMRPRSRTSDKTVSEGEVIGVTPLAKGIFNGTIKPVSETNYFDLWDDGFTEESPEHGSARTKIDPAEVTFYRFKEMAESEPKLMSAMRVAMVLADASVYSAISPQGKTILTRRFAKQLPPKWVKFTMRDYDHLKASVAAFCDGFGLQLAAAGTFTRCVPAPSVSLIANDLQSEDSLIEKTLVVWLAPTSPILGLPPSRFMVVFRAKSYGCYDIDRRPPHPSGWTYQVDSSSSDDFDYSTRIFFHNWVICGSPNEASETERENVCVICMDATAVITHDPCGHLVYCERCKGQTSLLPNAVCPICRA